MLDEQARLPATITAAAAAASDWDLVIAGAGPAGGATAIRAAQAGLRVLLLDKASFPRGKVCGCCLSPSALDELGRLDLVLSRQQLRLTETTCRIPLQMVQLLVSGRAATFGLPSGAVQSRESLDQAIIRAAILAGAAWLPLARVTSCWTTRKSVGLTASMTGGTEHSFVSDRLVLAGGLANAVRVETGTNSRPARKQRPQRNRIGLGVTLASEGSSLPEGQLVMAIGRSGYCGLVRLEDGRIDMAAAIDPASVAAAKSPATAIANLLADAEGKRPSLVERNVVENAVIRATPPLTHHTAAVDPSSERIYRVGDATAYVEPFTGEGIGWALSAARLLAESLLDPAGHFVPPAEAAGLYRRHHERGLRRQHRRCRLVALSLRSPMLIGTAVRAASCFPRAAGYVARCCTGR